MKTMNVILVLLLAACASQARPGQPASFQTGKTTLKEVEHALGEPNTRTVTAGRDTACYQYAGISTTPETFIRMVGPGAGQADLTCCFSFTPDEVLAGVAAKVNQISPALALAEKADHNAGRKITCPPRMLKPGTVVHVPFAGSR